MKEKSNRKEEPILTIHEQYIEDVLIGLGIKYEAKKKVEFSKTSEQTVTHADFYLPRLKMYIEYFGTYNKSKGDRRKFDELWQVYMREGLPVIDVKPEEIGIFEFLLHKRILRLMQYEKFRQGRRWALRRYLFNRFWQEGGFWSVFFGFIFILIALYLYGSEPDSEFTQEIIADVFLAIGLVGLLHSGFIFIKHIVFRF